MKVGMGMEVILWRYFVESGDYDIWYDARPYPEKEGSVHNGLIIVGGEASMW